MSRSLPTRRGLTALVRASARQGARSALIAALQATGSLKAARQRVAHNGDVAILTLHRIVPDTSIDICRSPRGMVLRESLFVELLDYLAKHADVLTPEQFTNDSQSIRFSARPRVLLTFDDGWIDNFEIALPHLTCHSFKACFFVVTSLAGVAKPFWPERILDVLNAARAQSKAEPLASLLASLSPHHRATLSPACSQDELLSWLKQFPPERIAAALEVAEAKLDNSAHTKPLPRPQDDPMEKLMQPWQWQALMAAGHSIGSHGATHALLHNLEAPALCKELTESHRDLEAHLPHQPGPLWIAYPNGNASRQTSSAAHKSGYRFGFLNRAGLWSKRSDPMMVPRINLWDGTLTDPNGQFSRRHAHYSLFWRPQHDTPQA